MTLATDPKETVMTTLVRTYELFDIRWARGSRWTGYWTREEAEATIAACSDHGTVERRTWEASWDLTSEQDVRLLALASPGIAERYLDENGVECPLVDA